MKLVTGPSTAEPMGNFLGDVGPGVAEGLLEAEGDAAFGGLDGEDDGFDGVAGFEDVAGLADFFGPGHFADVDEAFDAGLEFDEGAEVGEAGDGAADALAYVCIFRGRRPRARAGVA